MNIEDIYTTLQSIDLAKWASPVRDLVSTAASTTAGHFFSPAMVAQIGIGFQMGYSAAQSAYEKRSQYQSDDKYFLPFLLSDFVGSPRTSPLSCLVYYISGTLNDKWRTFFIAEKIYEHVRDPIPHGPKKFIDLNNTLIPFCYPNFQKYEHSQDPYGRCYQAVYESSFNTAHRLKESQQHVFYGSDGGQLKKHIVNVSPFGTFHIETKEDITLFERLLGQLTRHFTPSGIADQMEGKNLYLKNSDFSEENKSLIKKFQLFSFASERQASSDPSQKTPALQLSVPQDADITPEEVDSLVAFIEVRKAQRIVFHQQKSTTVGHSNAQKIAQKIAQRLRDKAINLSSLAYHSENPQESIPNPNEFYPLFSEVCTMGYNNPQELVDTSIIGSKDAKKNKNKNKNKKPSRKNTAARGIKSTNIQSHEKMASNWHQTRVYHVSLKRPPFTWISVPKTFLAMVLHDLVFEVYGATIGSFQKTSGSFNPLDILTYLDALLKGILASPKLAVQLLIFPIRLIFTACGAAYLYSTGQNNNLFEVGPKKDFNIALKSDEFATTNTSEYILSYKRDLSFSNNDTHQKNNNKNKNKNKNKRK